MKRCSKEFDVFSRQLNKHAPAVPPQGTAQEHAQVSHDRNVNTDHQNPTAAAVEEILNLGEG